MNLIYLSVIESHFGNDFILFPQLYILSQTRMRLGKWLNQQSTKRAIRKTNNSGWYSR